MGSGDRLRDNSRLEMATNGEDQVKPPLFQRIKAQNVLSFGPDGIDLELGPLNVLIGPNGSGKSNLLDVLGLLRASPDDVSMPVRRTGGTSEWIWKGNRTTYPTIGVEVSADSALPFPLGAWRDPIHHTVSFSGYDQMFWVVDERVWTRADPSNSSSEKYAYWLSNNQAMLTSRNPETQIAIPLSELKMDQSILSQRKDPVQYPELTHLGWVYGAMRFYRDWNFGGNAFFRYPQRTDLPRTPLYEDFSNLGVFLNKIQQNPKANNVLNKRLRDLYDGLTHFTLNFDGGTVQVFFAEGDFIIPATRLSDGSLRYLCLLAILLDPSPPPFIAIEEPELGLHPDLMPQIVDLLVDASRRTQLVVTTHNDTIVDALNDRPEAVVVCEKHDGQTEFKRLDRAELSHWLEKYRLGELWTKGAIGGTRW